MLFRSWLVPLKTGPITEPLLVGVGTVLGCWMLTSGVIQRVGWVRPLFGLKEKGNLCAGLKQPKVPTAGLKM